jgi:hypothetical protein
VFKYEAKSYRTGKKTRWRIYMAGEIWVTDLSAATATKVCLIIPDCRVVETP